MAMMLAMLGANVGMASAACAVCNPPSPGSSNVTAFTHANDQAQNKLTYNALKR